MPIMKTRIEHDLLGDLAVPADAWYGIQTQRALDNFPITGIPISHFPELIRALAQVNELYQNACILLDERCIRGIKANIEQCALHVDRSIGIITALVPRIGYANATRIAAEALNTGSTVRELVLNEALLSEAELDQLLSPRSMLAPQQEVK